QRISSQAASHAAGDFCRDGGDATGPERSRRDCRSESVKTIGADQAAFAYIGAFVEELSRGGVHHVCICPGSRSTPLALTIANHPSLKTWMHIDERSGAFFAL